MAAAASSTIAFLPLTCKHHQQQRGQKHQLRCQGDALGSLWTLFFTGSAGLPHFCALHIRSSAPPRQLSICAVASEPKQRALQENGLPRRKHLSSDADSVASNIAYNAEFRPLFSPFLFETSVAYHATAHTVRDALIERLNATYEVHQITDPKQACYLSMEFLQVSVDIMKSIG
ncbi:hypothetical protein L7F22_024543 [Adiantum nelumboides]|nr:hypothetical protein [Adiantum nelumboides]MCO5570815.1 hypothetical protein [Adiantum nelumboides]